MTYDEMIEQNLKLIEFYVVKGMTTVVAALREANETLLLLKQQEEN